MCVWKFWICGSEFRLNSIIDIIIVICNLSVSDIWYIEKKGVFSVMSIQNAKQCKRVTYLDFLI